MRLARRFYSTAAQVKSVNDIQKLYYTHPTSPGSIFLLPPGARIFAKLAAFVRAQMHSHGFQEVMTPQLFRKELWKISGHWEHYKDDMFGVCDGHGHAQIDGEVAEASGAEHEVEYSIKPMNCPGHCLIFKSQERSFRDLPIKYSDLSPLHRNEASGALTGLTRVRRFHQDDGHIFCTPEQVHSEIRKSVQLVDTIYKVFGLEYSMNLSTRPSDYTGELSLWNAAEKDLQSILESYGSYKINEGDGAFYGPKIDFIVKDNQGRQHQAATIQLDFQLPRKFGLEYDGADQQKHVPVMVHRAVFGSFERFMALLIDHVDGRWPFWLNPRQAIILPISGKHSEYAESIYNSLCGLGIKDQPLPLQPEVYDCELMAQAEPLGGRIRRATELHPNYILVVGDREMENNTVSVKPRGSKKSITMTLPELKDLFREKELSFS